jgi:uncharacterized peroxidase-related enzyme
MSADYRLTLPALSSADAEYLARARLDEAQQKLRFVPNMYAVMANSPGLLDTYVHGYERFRAMSGFSPTEQEVVLLTISRENRCTYCVAAHSFLADQVSAVPAAVTEAIRAGTPMPDAKLAALSTFTRVMLTTRGLPDRAEVASFLEAGYTERQVLEIVLAIAVKTLSNYSNHLFHTPVDAVFAGRAWQG